MLFKKYEGTTPTSLGNEIVNATVEMHPLGASVISPALNSIPMEFDFLVGDVNWAEYGGTWISKEPLDVEDFGRCWFVLEFLNMYEAMGRDALGSPPFHVTISVVCPDAVPPQNKQRAFDCVGLECKEFGFPNGGKLEDFPEAQVVEALYSYGIKAPVWQCSGGTQSISLWDEPEGVSWDVEAKALLEKAKKCAPVIAGLFGLFMDQPLNRMGTSGWDFARGEL